LQYHKLNLQTAIYIGFNKLLVYHNLFYIDVEEMVVTPGTAALPLKRPLPAVNEGFEPAPVQNIVSVMLL
jgi:hypothetical protein